MTLDRGQIHMRLQLVASEPQDGRPALRVLKFVSLQTVRGRWVRLVGVALVATVLVPPWFLEIDGLSEFGTRMLGIFLVATVPAPVQRRSERPMRIRHYSAD